MARVLYDISFLGRTFEFEKMDRSLQYLCDRVVIFDKEIEDLRKNISDLQRANDIWDYYSDRSSDECEEKEPKTFENTVEKVVETVKKIKEL